MYLVPCTFRGSGKVGNENHHQSKQGCAPNKERKCGAAGDGLQGVFGKRFPVRRSDLPVLSGDVVARSYALLYRTVALCQALRNADAWDRSDTLPHAIRRYSPDTSGKIFATTARPQHTKQVPSDSLDGTEPSNGFYH